MKKQLNPPAEGVYSFIVGPDMFRAYAEWKKKAKAKVVARTILPSPEGQTMLVWFCVRGVHQRTSS